MFKTDPTTGDNEEFFIRLKIPFQLYNLETNQVKFYGMPEQLIINEKLVQRGSKAWCILKDIYLDKNKGDKQIQMKAVWDIYNNELSPI